MGAAEELPGGFSAVYEVLRTMEETGKIRRGYFVGGVAAMQFALPPVLEMLRGLRARPETPEVVTLLAVDPANPYGALLPWPGTGAAAHEATGGDGDGDRAGARAAPPLGGQLRDPGRRRAGRLGRPRRPPAVQLPARRRTGPRPGGRGGGGAPLARLAGGERRATGQLLAEIDDTPAARHPLADALAGVGFLRHLRRPAVPPAARRP